MDSEERTYCCDSIIREDDGYLSSLWTVHGVESDEDSPHWFLRVSLLNKKTGRMFAENFPASYCPVCGKEL